MSATEKSSTDNGRGTSRNRLTLALKIALSILAWAVFFGIIAICENYCGQFNTRLLGGWITYPMVLGWGTAIWCLALSNPPDWVFIAAQIVGYLIPLVCQILFLIKKWPFPSLIFYIVLIIHLVISLWAMQGLEGMASC